MPLGVRDDGGTTSILHSITVSDLQPLGPCRGVVAIVAATTDSHSVAWDPKSGRTTSPGLDRDAEPDCQTGLSDPGVRIGT